MLKNRQLYSKIHPFYSKLWPILAILLMLAAILMNIAASESWRSAFLYGGDSITLGMIAQSIQHGEPLKWVLSSQLFFFPEGLIYAACYLIGGSPYISFILNSVVIIFLLYLLFLSIARYFFSSLLTRQLVSLIIIGIITLYATLETQAWINQSAIATLLFISTYYYGVILASLFLIFTTLSLIDLFAKAPQYKRRIQITMIIACLIVAVTGASNPLLFIQFSFPYLLVIGYLYLINTLSGKLTTNLAGIQLVGISIALIIRHAFSGLIGSDTQSYLNISKIPEATEGLRDTLRLIAEHNESIFEFGIILCLILFALAYMLFVTYRLNRKHFYDPKELFLIFIAGISPVVIFAAILVTGNSPTRYYQPLLALPLLSVIVLFSRLHANNLCRNIPTLLTAALCIYFSIFIITKIPHAQPLNHSVSSDMITCFQNYAKDKPSLNAVSGFWTARPLDFYENNPSKRVLQVDINLRKLGWMNNLSTYDNKKFDTVISGHTDSTVLNILQLQQPPSEQTECPHYTIYRYSIGSRAYKILNEQVHKPAVH